MAHTPVSRPRNQEPRHRDHEPDNSHTTPGHRQDHHRAIEKDSAYLKPNVQFEIDAPDAHYANDVSDQSWLRNGDATTRPNFDKHQNAWRSPSKGNAFGRETIKDYAADHNRHFSEFRGRHNAGETHATEFHDFSQRHIASYERSGEYTKYVPLQERGRKR